MKTAPAIDRKVPLKESKRGNNFNLIKLHKYMKIRTKRDKTNLAETTKLTTGRKLLISENLTRTRSKQ